MLFYGMKYLAMVASAVALLFFVFSSGKAVEYAAENPLFAVEATVKNSQDEALFESMAQEYKDSVSFSIRYLLPISIHSASVVVNGQHFSPPFKKEILKTLIDAEIVKVRAESRGASVHEHADFAVFVEGKQLDFSAPQFQSTEDKELDADIHLHDGVGTVIHKHKAVIPLSDFFASVGMKFDDKCLTLVNGKQFCSDQDSLTMYVNGQKSTSFGSYVLMDLDTILIIAGTNQTEAQSANLMKRVTSDACMYSQKCPERGKPPTEACVGGLGSDCQ